MTRIIATLALIALCLGAVTAYAGPIRIGGTGPSVYVQSYNNSFGQGIRTIGTYIGQIVGFNRMSVVYTHNNGCLQVIVTKYAGPFVVSQTMTEFCK